MDSGSAVAPLFTISLNFSLSLILIFVFPRTTIAFKFFEAITAPIPVLPWARLALLIIELKGMPFSAAIPHWAIWMRSSPNSLRIKSSASAVNFPTKWRASLISITPSWIQIYTKCLALPVTTSPSNPVFLNSAGKNPPACESPINPETGDFAVAVILDNPEIVAPVITLGNMQKVFLGPNGSAPAGVFFKR